MIDDYIKKLLKQAEQQEKWAANYMPDNYDDNPTTPKERYQHAKECRQLAEWLTELKEAKRLLKLAVEDLAKIPCNNDVYIPSSCNACIKQGNCDYSDSFKWRYADEALKLIGGSENE